MNPAACSILIPTRNRPALLAQTLSELRKIGLGDWPLWVYDDASSDAASARKAVSIWPGGQVIPGQTRAGQAHGRNVLLRACGTPWAVCLDDDQYFLELGCLRERVAGPPEDERLAGVVFQSRAKRDGRLDVPAHVTARVCPRFTGGCVLFRVAAVRDAGGYRDCLIYGYEEPDLACRLWARGYRLWYDPSILVEHNQWDTPDEQRDTAEYDYLYARNGILLATLNMPFWFGLPLGIMRSARRSWLFRRSPCAHVRGAAAGIIESFTRWRERTPLSFSSARAWQRFCRHWADSAASQARPE